MIQVSLAYRIFLRFFFGSHDPTTLNRQGADVGTQYRSVIFYTNDEQKDIALKIIQEINDSSKNGDSVTTEVLPLPKFYVAESYHQDYFAMNKEATYCQLVINPKLEKVQKQFAELLEDQK
jgi:peptide-methionine (S)-S-oxide reductase